MMLRGGVLPRMALDYRPRPLSTDVAFLPLSTVVSQTNLLKSVISLGLVACLSSDAGSDRILLLKVSITFCMYKQSLLAFRCMLRVNLSVSYCVVHLCCSVHRFLMLRVGPSSVVEVHEARPFTRWVKLHRARRAGAGARSQTARFVGFPSGHPSGWPQRINIPTRCGHQTLPNSMIFSSAGVNSLFACARWSFGMKLPQSASSLCNPHAMSSVAFFCLVGCKTLTS